MSADSENGSTHHALQGLFVGASELKEVHLQQCRAGDEPAYEIGFRIADKDRNLSEHLGQGVDLQSAIAAAVQTVSSAEIRLKFERSCRTENLCQWIVEARCDDQNKQRLGVGKFVSDMTTVGAVFAALRAINNAGLLKANLRANNQKQLRQVSRQALDELIETLGLGSLPSSKDAEAEGVLLEHINRIASAAVIIASNHPRKESILSLYDTSSWLYDSSGGRRDAMLETDHWLAWYPGLNNGHKTAAEIIDSMPAAGPQEIPKIVRMLENPESIFRFRGAVSLSDHDMLHVMLGRGLQDQDEAFVIGFAMGTSKRANRFQAIILKFFLSRIYPEPYRVPIFLLPAFDLGLECGKQTGIKDLYKQDLNAYRHLPMSEVRKRFEIDVEVLRRFYREEQQRIPMTIASVRLPC